MKDRLAGNIIFWFAASVPLFATIMISKLFGSYWFAIFLLIYALIYRPILHIVRLLNLGAIDEKDAWKFFLPLYDIKYFRVLWIGRKQTV